jgi:hypothetical protein
VEITLLNFKILVLTLLFLSDVCNLLFALVYDQLYLVPQFTFLAYQPEHQGNKKKSHQAILSVNYLASSQSL